MAESPFAERHVASSRLLVSQLDTTQLDHLSLTTSNRPIEQLSVSWPATAGQQRRRPVDGKLSDGVPSEKLLSVISLYSAPFVEPAARSELRAGGQDFEPLRDGRTREAFEGLSVRMRGACG